MTALLNIITNCTLMLATIGPLHMEEVKIFQQHKNLVNMNAKFYSDINYGQVLAIGYLQKLKTHFYN